MAKEMSEEQRQGILDAVSKFLNRDNIYSSVHGGQPRISIKSLAGLEPYDITGLFFEYNIRNLKVYFLDEKTTIVWKTGVLPMEQFPEAYKMFFNKYEQLEGDKIPKEEIEKYRKELEMWEDKKYEETQKKIKQELIINNAFEFLKREDLILAKGINNKIMSKEEPVEPYEISYIYGIINSDVLIIVCHNTTLQIDINEYKELYELFQKKYRDLLQAQQIEPQDTTDYTIKHDQNKHKLSQFPREAMEAVVEVMEYGARKYGKGTWSRVEAQRYVDAAARHLYAMQDIDENGKEFINFSKVDDESGLEHLYHLACNAVYAVALYKRGKGNETR